jgi:hypothetical protein
VVEEEGQQVELPGPERGLPARPPHDPGDRVHLQPGHRQRADGAAGRPVGGPPGAAQQGLHPGEQHAQGEGLADVVVRARLQPHHPVDLVPPRRAHQDGRGAQPAAALEAVQAGEQDGEDDQVRVGLLDHRQRPDSLPGGAHVVALAAQGVAE